MHVFIIGGLIFSMCTISENKVLLKFGGRIGLTGLLSIGCTGSPEMESHAAYQR